MLSKIKYAWKNRNKIWEGIFNFLFPTLYVDKIASERLNICYKCEYFDVLGRSSKCYVRGEPCCAACGCKIKWAVRSLSKSCGLEELGKEPLWKAVMTEKEEDKFRNKTGVKHE